MDFGIMAVVLQISTEHNIYPNLTVYDRIADGVAAGWEVRANEGYVFYDTTANNTDFDPETGEEVPVTFYYIIRMFPRNYNWANFSLVAVPREGIDENYIFGGGVTTTK